MLLLKEVILGDVAGSSVSLTFGMPAESVHINASFALSGKGSSQLGGSFGAMDPRRTVHCYQIFVVSGGEDCSNSSQNAPSLWRQLSRPKKSVRVGGDWQNKGRGCTGSM